MTCDSDAAQRVEPFLIAIQDGSYGVSDDEWPAASAAFRRGLEAEFGVSFEEGNIGPSVDLPAFITLLQTPTVPLWQLAVAGFLLGKPIKDNWEAWRDMARAIRTYFSRSTFLNRESAIPIAVDALIATIDEPPTSIRLLGYEVGQAIEPVDVASEIEGVSEGPDTIYLGFVKHVFEVKADGERFRVAIEGTTINVQRMPLRGGG
ncbi:hypothetical protein [Brevundimonas aurifodinae]|uniref:Uncharacterized protein n=1 Tax=Brevundimonas aurifodinae TaxID=1508312 RepID=A0ABV1NMC0_9CAUL